MLIKQEVSVTLLGRAFLRLNQVFHLPLVMLRFLHGYDSAKDMGAVFRLPRFGGATIGRIGVGQYAAHGGRHRHFGHSGRSSVTAFGTLITRQLTSLPLHACQQVRMK